MASATSTPTAPASSTSSGGRSSARRGAAAGSSPTGLSRVQEKDEMRSLNDRLANYIQRVQELEGERSFMLAQLEEKDESKSREMGTVRRLYEQELADVRSSLDGLAAERARLQLELKDLAEETERLKARNQKRENDLANALTKWRKAEAALNSKDAEHTKLLSENQRLNEDFGDLQGQLEQVEAVLSETKTQLNAETLRRVDMENKTQTLREQLDLQKNLSEEEMMVIRSRHESRLVEVELGRRKDFESKLAEAMLRLRNDHENQLLQYKEEMERTFSSKLQNAQQAALEKHDVASTTREELETTKLRMETLNSQLQQYQKEKMSLDGRVQELEQTLDRERDVWQLKLGQKEQEMMKMRSQMYTQLEDYEDLLDVKLALDMEISAYRKMLEVEEQRLQLTPSPSQRTSRSQTHEHSGRRHRGKKRKYEGEPGCSPTYRMSSHVMMHGHVSLAEVDTEGKYIRLKNSSDREQPLDGWVIRRVYENTRDLSFHFPSSCTLAGGQTLTIWAAGAKVEPEPEDLILEGHSSWGTIPDVRVVLLNRDHEEVAEHILCAHGKGVEDSDLMFEEFVAGSDMQHFRGQPKKKKKCCSIS
ncbi:lamin L3 [Pholidichthys leucotaenia]